jgi:DNA-binding PadR family transcriptional regulator
MSRAEKKPLSQRDYPFLAMLLLAPMSVYQIKKAMEASVSHFYSAAHSQVYQQANRLLRDGFVKEKEEREGRRKRTLALTPAGRKEVLAWLRDPEADDQLYSELLVKVFFAANADDPEGLRELLERRREHSQGMVDEYKKVLPSLEAYEDNPYPAMTMSSGIHFYRAEVAWIDETVKKLEAMERKRRR